MEPRCQWCGGPIKGKVVYTDWNLCSFPCLASESDEEDNIPWIAEDGLSVPYGSRKEEA